MMASKQNCPEMEVTIHSKKLVKPFSPTPENLRNLWMSSLDQLAPETYVPVILYYPANDEGQGAAQEVSDRKRQLEESLTTILNLYYPVAGRYIPDKHMIDCNDEGIELLEATVNCELSRLVAGNFHVHELNRLFSYRYVSPSTPLMIVQLNVFACGGMAIALVYSHRIMDGFTNSRLIHGWSIACNQGIDKVPRPSFMLGSLFPARDRLPAVHPTTGKKEEVKIVTRRFLFNQEAIQFLRAMASNGDAECSELPGSKFSRVVVVTALIWMALIRTSQAKGKGNLRPCMLKIAADLRNRIRFPIPPSSCGNLVIPSNAIFVAGIGKCTVEYAELVHLLHDSIGSTTKKCAEFMTWDDLLVGVADAFNEIGGEYGHEVDIYKCTPWCSLPYYEADFGWGKPIWVSSSHKPVNKFIVLLNTKDGNGIEAWVSLAENRMLTFQQDPEILAFAQ